MEFVLFFIANILAVITVLFMISHYLRPNIQISPFICRSAVSYDGTTRYYHFIKIVNHSSFDAYDVKIDLQLLSKSSADEKTNVRHTALTPVSNAIPLIAKKDSKNEQGDNCVIIRTADNLKRYLQDADNSVEITVSLKHALSGLAKVYRHKYTQVSAIKEGTFAYGQQFTCEKDLQLAASI